MKEYDIIAVGTGSAMNIISPITEKNPKIRVAVIDKDEPGGICLTRGCIPSKLLLYPADLVREIEGAAKFGIDVELKSVDFKRVMERMRSRISENINTIRRGLSGSSGVDYYRDVAEFIAPYTMKVGNETITSKMIFLCTGSRPGIPPVKGLEEAGYLTSDTVLGLTELPASIGIMGGGFIAAEYAHFFSAMGSKVTIIGRNPRFLPDEEPEISELAKKEMSKYMTILTNHEVVEVHRAGKEKRIIAKERSSGKKTDGKGWIAVNEYFETSQQNIWAFGDADGKYLFKHVANYESVIVYHNAFLGKKVKADYHAVPYAIFSHPEIASVGMKEKQAIEKYREKNVLIGFYRYQDTARGDIMEVRDCFVKVIVERNSGRILGAHIIGPHASILIQEIINLMYTPLQSFAPVVNGMHIHPALSEVVERAFRSLMPLEHYRHVREEQLE